ITAGISINNFLAQVERVGFHTDQLSVQLLSPSVLHWTDNRYNHIKILSKFTFSVLVNFLASN
ncbi:hypothetical protein, partial [aff. Roholtiella sp. LEGE 12411]|uniref:hypothetical protein n=1 Tax=aff. Roholtiella sp. LEGE 12411 TaxID=1828822 RepID=UPI001ABC211C